MANSNETVIDNLILHSELQLILFFWYSREKYRKLSVDVVEKKCKPWKIRFIIYWYQTREPIVYSSCVKLYNL